MHHGTKNDSGAHSCPWPASAPLPLPVLYYRPRYHAAPPPPPASAQAFAGKAAQQKLSLFNSAIPPHILVLLSCPVEHQMWTAGHISPLAPASNDSNATHLGCLGCYVSRPLSATQCRWNSLTLQPQCLRWRDTDLTRVH